MAALRGALLCTAVYLWFWWRWHVHDSMHRIYWLMLFHAQLFPSHKQDFCSPSVILISVSMGKYSASTHSRCINSEARMHRHAFGWISQRAKYFTHHTLRHTRGKIHQHWFPYISDDTQLSCCCQFFLFVFSSTLRLVSVYPPFWCGQISCSFLDRQVFANLRNFDFRRHSTSLSVLIPVELAFTWPVASSAITKKFLRNHKRKLKLIANR